MDESIQSRPGLVRRTLLATMPAVVALGLASKTALAQALPTGSTPAQRQAALAALYPYCGVYEIAPGHSIGVNRFITDGGESVLLFADYRTSVVRRLFQQSPTEFVMGPTFDLGAPVELTVRFQMAADGQAQGLSLRWADRTETAVKLAVREEEVAFRQGDANLAGTLIVPAGPGPHPAIVLLQGSGPLTRHSFGPYPRFFNSLGLAVLIYDKRSTGASTGRLIDAGTGDPEILAPVQYPDDLVADALAAKRFLEGRPEIDAKRIGFWGSSEGGMLATQTPAHDPAIAFAIDSSGFMGPLWETLLYQGGALMRQAALPEADIAQAMAFNRFWMEVARTGEGYDAFLARREAIVKSGKPWLLFYDSATFSSLEQMRWVWSHILTFDPVPALKQVKCPVLGVFGQADPLTDATVAANGLRQALTTSGNRDVTTRIFPNAGHSLMETPSRKGMAPGVFDTLRDWLAPRVGTASA